MKRGGFLAIAWALALVALLLVGSSQRVSRPPEPIPERDLGMLVGLAAIALALWSSRLAGEAKQRVFPAAVVLLTIGTEYLAFTNFLANEAEIPWLACIPMLGLVCVGGWFCKQRVLALATALVPVALFTPALVPPRTPMPVTVISRGLRATLLPEGSGVAPAWSVSFKDLEGHSATSLLDTSNVRAYGSLGPGLRLLDVPATNYHAVFPDSVGPEGDVFDFRLRMPPWVQRWDLRVEAQLWPAHPTASVVIPLQPFVSSPREARAGVYTLEVTAPRWEPTSVDGLPGRSLAMAVSYSGFSYGGGSGSEVRFTDESGQALRWTSNSMSGSESGTSLQVVVGPIPPHVKAVHVVLYSERQLADNMVVFEFPALPRSGPSQGD